MITYFKSTLLPIFLVSSSTFSLSFKPENSQPLSDQLHTAADSGKRLDVKDALNRGAEIEAQAPCDKRTALSSAAFKGHCGVVQFLLNKMANKEAIDVDGNTALILAAVRGHNNAVELLLTNGANVEATDNEGNTALALAASRQSPDTVTALLKHCASLEATNMYGRTPLELANNTEVRTLLEEAHKT